MRTERAAIIAAVIAHVLAWGAFLWLAFWSYAYQGVSATPVQVNELGNPVGEMEMGVERHSASLVEVNGVQVLLPLFIPALLTGMALIALLAWSEGGVRRKILVWILTAALLGFCVLGYLSIGVLYVPAAIALVVATVLQSLRSGRRI